MDPVDTIVQEQADACICYNQAECANECELGTDNCADDATCTDTADLFLCSETENNVWSYLNSHDEFISLNDAKI